MPAVETADALLDLVVSSGLLPPETVAPYRTTDPPALLASLLVRDRLPTPSQAA